MRTPAIMLLGLVTLACAPARPSAARVARPPGAAPATPSYVVKGWTHPRERSAGCVRRAVEVPPDLAGTVRQVTVKFAVRADGAADSFECITALEDGPAPGGTVQRFLAQLEHAVASCEYEPGLDDQGDPADTWKVMVLRF